MNEALGARWARRALTIPLYALAALALIASAPLWIPLAFVADRLRPGQCALRVLAFAVVFLVCEAIGLLLATALWVRRPFVPSRAAAPDARSARYRDDHYALQTRWVGWLFAAAQRLFRLRVEVSGSEALAREPMLLFLRHASLADTAIAGTQVTRPTGIALRYVMKRELLWDPCLDIVGQRVPNVFARRGSDDPASEIARVAALLHDLAPNEGVLIYPEGTRFSPAKRARAIARLHERGDHAAAARAEALRHVLPPRLGGPCALLEANPGLDVLVCAHTGLEAAATLAQCWNGALLDGTLRIHFWRIPFTALPVDRAGREAFLFEQWQRVDDWLEENRQP